MHDDVRTHVRKAFKSLGDDVTFSRYVKVMGRDKTGKKSPRQAWLPNLRHKVLETGRSIFWKKGVKQPEEMKRVLVSGHSNVKIGRDVRKGKLRGYWIYTLSLEERNTCPRSCQHWQDCYGNNMPYAKRVAHGPALEAALAKEIPGLLAKRGRKGVLIRLHALGDFYSVGYVGFWHRMLREHKGLSVYGYTARLPGTDIGDAVALVKKMYGDRFAIRYSDGGFLRDSTYSVEDAEGVPADAFLCPEQTGKTLGCGTCALCWATTKNVAFAAH